MIAFEKDYWSDDINGQSNAYKEEHHNIGLNVQFEKDATLIKAF